MKYLRLFIFAIVFGLALTPQPLVAAATSAQLTVTITPLECTIDVVDDGIQYSIRTTSPDCRRAYQEAK